MDSAVPTEPCIRWGPDPLIGRGNWGGDFLRSTVRKVQGISGMRSVFSTLFGRWQQRFGARCHCRSNLSLTAARLSGLLPLALPRPYPLFFSLFLLSCSLLSFHPALCLPFIDSLVSLSRSSKLTPSHTMLFRKYSVHIGMKVSNVAVLLLLSRCIHPATHEETVILEENVV